MTTPSAARLRRDIKAKANPKPVHVFGPVCGDCAFWNPLPNNVHLGECRRFPPTKNAGATQRWVLTVETDNCGEYKPKVVPA